MGYSTKFDTRAATYKVIINSFKFLPSTTKDAAFGLTALFFLYFTRWIFGRLERKAKNPLLKKIYFFAATMRTVSTMHLYFTPQSVSGWQSPPVIRAVGISQVLCVANG